MQLSLQTIHGSRAVITVSQETPAQAAAVLMAEHDIGALPVVDTAGNLVGILSERDLIRRGILQQKDLATTPVAALMTRRVCVSDAEEDYRTGLAKMRQAKCRHLPIVQDGKPIGIVSMRDLLDHQLADYEFDMQMLEKYITS